MGDDVNATCDGLRIDGDFKGVLGGLHAGLGRGGTCGGLGGFLSGPLGSGDEVVDPEGERESAQRDR
ncbi:hypothetical protein [Sphingobium sp. CCH11-B1]|uniref:hypothetical protein n=1 Tax=Sphingobium sp. CCH11-B1 TaxID=1768781 RepID=UPI0018D22FEA|nr:hypothetical protein [Sphingobium sp. CCH11-B1]